MIHDIYVHPRNYDEAIAVLDRGYGPDGWVNHHRVRISDPRDWEPDAHRFHVDAVYAAAVYCMASILSLGFYRLHRRVNRPSTIEVLDMLNEAGKVVLPSNRFR